MNIPDSKDKKWEQAISGDAEYQFKFLATKILLGRLRLSYQNDSSPQQMSACINELRAFFEKNQNVPVAMEDLKEIVGG